MILVNNLPLVYGVAALLALLVSLLIIYFCYKFYKKLSKSKKSSKGNTEDMKVNTDHYNRKESKWSDQTEAKQFETVAHTALIAAFNSQESDYPTKIRTMSSGGDSVEFKERYRPDKTQWNVIAAVDENMCVGKNGVLPWHLPSEFQYFLSMTTMPRSGLQNVIITGRKTWETMDKVATKPFPNSLNIVLSRGHLPEVRNYQNTVVARNLDEAMDIVQKETNIDEVWVLGGSEVFSSTLQSPYFHRLYLTHIQEKYDCDTYFPFMKLELEFGYNFKRLLDDEINDPRVPVGIQTDHISGIKFEVKVYGKRDY